MICFLHIEIIDDNIIDDEIRDDNKRFCIKANGDSKRWEDFSLCVKILKVVQICRDKIN